MARLSGIDPTQAEPRVSEVLEKQRVAWGEPLKPYLLYARRPSIIMGVRGMWDALGESGLLPDILARLVCRRVASINGCVF
ncbi:MAG: alkylhydroperoxidase family enzyme [Verrucomicrobiales bacterium]|jgi:alkylhydroperoxidase family enzyme